HVAHPRGGRSQLAGEVRLDRRHPGVDEQQCRVVDGNQRGALDAPVVVPLEEFEELGADLLAGKMPSHGTTVCRAAVVAAQYRRGPASPCGGGPGAKTGHRRRDRRGQPISASLGSTCSANRSAYSTGCRSGIVSISVTPSAAYSPAPATNPSTSARTGRTQSTVLM